MLVYKWYQELKKLKGQFQHWVRDRQGIISKEEQKLNPTMVFKWMLKMHPFSDKTKKIGKIISYSTQPFKTNPSGHKDLICRVTAKTRHLAYLIWWHPTNFAFSKNSVFVDTQKGIIKIPANYFWERNSEGTMLLMSPRGKDIKDWVDEKMYKDIHEIAIDGYASQMTSYSSVKPTWGHEERIVEKENEGRALGFGGFLKKKKPEKKED